MFEDITQVVIRSNIRTRTSKLMFKHKKDRKAKTGLPHSR